MTFRDRKSFFLPVLARVNGIVAAAARFITIQQRKEERERERILDFIDRLIYGKKIRI